MGTAISAATRAELDAKIRSLMPELREWLERLIAIPSVAFPGFPSEPIHEAHDLVRELAAEAGVILRDSLRLPDTSPVVWGEIPAPPGAPTVLLYCHYDVVPAGEESDWESPPFIATEREGAIYGRGTADSKSNLMVHLGALRAFGGRPPVGIKLVIEGQEEAGSAFDYWPEKNPEFFHADAMVIADVGNVRPGVPTLTVALRGDAAVTVEVNTLGSAKHSGQFGGAAPDALLVLMRALATLHDDSGDVAVPGLLRTEWAGSSYTEAEFAELAEMLPGTVLQGTGGLGERIWSGPALTVTGIDVPSVEGAVNAVSPHARARINLRVHPEQDAREAQAALIAYLEAQTPFGISLEVAAGDTGNGYSAAEGGPAYHAALAALGSAWEAEPTTAAIGGSIPLVNSLHLAAPEAEILLFGTADGFSRIHAPNERVLIDEFERAILAEALFLSELASRKNA